MDNFTFSFKFYQCLHSQYYIKYQSHLSNKASPKHVDLMTQQVWSHWVKLFFMNTFGKLALSSNTALLSIWEQKDTSRRERSLQDSRSFLNDAGLTILVPSMSSCCNLVQLDASSSMSVSHTDLLAVRKSFCKFGSWRASLAKHPVLLWRVGHQPRSSSSRSTHPEASSAIPFSVKFLHLHRSRVRRFLHLAPIMLAITS